MVYNSLLYLFWWMTCPSFSHWESLQAGICVRRICPYYFGRHFLTSRDREELLEQYVPEIS